MKRAKRLKFKKLKQHKKGICIRWQFPFWWRKGDDQTMEYMGILAGICTSCSFIPQAFHIIKTHRTEDISLLTYCIYVCGVTLWILYGLYRQDIAVWLTNMVSLVPGMIILTMKMKESKQEHTSS